MKEPSILREFTRYTSLNVIAMISVSCYILADTFFIAMALGTDGLAALNFAIPIFSFIIGGGLMLGIGGATRYSILKGQNDADKANRAYTNTIFLMAGFSAFFFAAGLFFPNAITRILGTDETVFEMTKIYLQLLLLFAPVFIAQQVFLCFIRNDGSPQLAMISTVAGSFLNILLDYLLIIMLDMGMFGAALATGFSQIGSLLILATFFLQKKNSFRFARPALSRPLTADILKTGAPSLIAELSIGIVIIVFNIIILSLQGSVGVAAYAIIANILVVVIAIYTGLAQGIQPLLSKNYGSGNIENVKKVLRYALIAVAGISGAVYLFIFFGATQIVNIFNSEQNAVLQSLAENGLRLYFTACIFAGFNIIMPIYFTSTERTRPAHIISILRGFILLVPMVFLLSALAGITGTWLAFPATELAVSLVCIAFFLYGKAD
ncbi:MAG: MATE family efflux transporter [Spirochaetes bacterium]|nr:MATE family efflux transporter [Spirochaetota bacterium]